MIASRKIADNEVRKIERTSLKHDAVCIVGSLKARKFARITTRICEGEIFFINLKSFLSRLGDFEFFVTDNKERRLLKLYV